MISDQQLLAAVVSLECAFAIVDIRDQSVTLVSDGFRSIVPSLSKNVSWSDAIADEPDLQAAFDTVLVTRKANSVHEILLDGEVRRADFKFVDTHQLVVSVRPVESLTANLHDYIQARDNLFSTSRTISVSEMATTLAHELNTPIGTISNLLEGMKLRLSKPDTQVEVLDSALTRALEQTQFTQNIISRIREFTQSRRPKHQVLDLRDQLNEAVSLLDWMLQHNNCRIQFDLPSYPLHVVGDATMLQQVLINLIRNAIDAMEHQTETQRTITITASQNVTYATVSIADTGQGLGDNADTLFVPFSTNKPNGMGVGLNICRSFIELHQGRLWLSPNDGEGCTSFIELPVSNE